MTVNPAIVTLEYTSVAVFTQNQYPKKPNITRAYVPDGTESEINPFVCIPLVTYPLWKLIISKPILFMKVFNLNTTVVLFCNVKVIALIALKIELLIIKKNGILNKFNSSV
jgi:hypothetical protein